MNLKEIEKAKILVLGDIMLDSYVVGNVLRISPEAPVPIVHVNEEYYTLGGCGNVVRNIRELGAQVDCLASVGNDLAGQTIKNELINLGVGDYVFTGSEVTTVKERIIAEHRLVQMIRIDREIVKMLDPTEAIKILDKLNGDYDIIVISDYAKGMISSQLIKHLKATQRARIIVDPKPQNAWMYNKVFMITPNEKEWVQMMASNNFKPHDIEYVLQTMGKKGMKLIQRQFKEWFIEAEPVDIYNVSGAGDTVIAVMAVCLSMGIDVNIAANIANKCAGYVVTQPGTSVVPLQNFKDIVNRYI